MSIKHFKIDDSHTDVWKKYQMLLTLAERWERYQIKSVKTFLAGMCTFYISIDAARWYTIQDANDEEWQGDAQDPISDGVFALSYRHLISRSHPETRWLGAWRTFPDAISLAKYAQDMLDRLHGET